MRTYTEEFTVYTYSELDDDAKEKVKEWYLEDNDRSWFFAENIREFLKWEEKQPGLDVQFSLSCCQGDGLNIYGSFDLSMMLEKFSDSFTEKEWRALAFYLREAGDIVKVAPNNKYCYCILDHADFTENIEYYCSDLRDYRAGVVERFNDLCRDYWSDFCSRWEANGYDYFYEIDDEEMEETADANGWEFFADGQIA